MCGCSVRGPVCRRGLLLQYRVKYAYARVMDAYAITGKLDTHLDRLWVRAVNLYHKHLRGGEHAPEAKN